MKTTKFCILLLTLVFMNSSALAEWTEIEKYEDNTRVFVDKTTAHRSGDTGQVEHLVRWGEAQLDPGHPPYLSTVVRTSYDCLEKRERYLTSTSYAGAMGNGAKVLSDPNEAETWYSISEGSMEEKLWKLACSAP